MCGSERDGIKVIIYNCPCYNNCSFNSTAGDDNNDEKQEKKNMKDKKTICPTVAAGRLEGWVFEGSDKGPQNIGISIVDPRNTEYRTGFPTQTFGNTWNECVDSLRVSPCCVCVSSLLFLFLLPFLLVFLFLFLCFLCVPAVEKWLGIKISFITHNDHDKYCIHWASL